VGERVSLFREPDAGNLPVRFDEREQETESGQTGLRRSCESIPTATGRLKPLRLFSTLLSVTLIGLWSGEEGTSRTRLGSVVDFNVSSKAKEPEKVRYEHGNAGRLVLDPYRWV
jgi:hypothetical protein